VGPAVSFSKILIANRGDNRSAAEVAAKAQLGAAELGRSQNAKRAQHAAVEPREPHVQ